MTSRKILGLLLMLLTMACGTAGNVQPPPALDQAGAAYEEHAIMGMSRSKSTEWNSTDWSLWMDMQGGGN